ncbi:hypothetical protein FKM82_001057 [Ascaphus truei]
MFSAMFYMFYKQPLPTPLRNLVKYNQCLTAAYSVVFCISYCLLPVHVAVCLTYPSIVCCYTVSPLLLVIALLYFTNLLSFLLLWFSQMVFLDSNASIMPT